MVHALKYTNNWVVDFLRESCQEALEIEFKIREIPYEREKELPIDYKSVKLKKKYYVDFFCYDKIIVEIKACSGLLN